MPRVYSVVVVVVTITICFVVLRPKPRIYAYNALLQQLETTVLR